MLDKGINVNTLNDYGYNVLIAALHISDPENRGKMFRYLINRNANPTFKDAKHGK
jgi:transposase